MASSGSGGVVAVTAPTHAPPISESQQRAQAKTKRLLEAQAVANQELKDATGVDRAAARAKAMAATKAVIEAINFSAKGPQLSEVPNMVRGKLEMARFKANATIHKSISFEHRVEERRIRLEGLTSSKAEADRMYSVHSAQREETRRHLLRATIKEERAMLDILKHNGVKNFAGLADAFG